MDHFEVTRTLLPRASQSAGNTGKNQNSQGSSVSALLSTLIPILLISTAIFIAFLIFRKRAPRAYYPRTYLGSLRNWQRSPEQTSGLLGWKKQYSALKDEFVLGHASIDNYLWLRFFRTLTAMCFVGCLITWPILFPVNATGSASNAKGLDILSFSHINPGPRYYAQVFVSWMFLAWVMFLITRESRFFVRLRHHYYSSPFESSKISTKTLLFVNVPESMRNEESLRRDFSDVRTVWLVNVPEKLAEDVEERDKAANKLETGEVKLIQNYVKRQIKQEKKGGVSQPAENREAQQSSIAVDKKDRPSHRLPKLKFLPIGKKVDTIDWSRGELRRLVPEIAQTQSGLRSNRSNPQGACFIEFETVHAAHIALLQCQAKTKDKAKSTVKMTPKELGTAPQDVIWKNTIKPWPKVKSFSAICTTFIWFLCIFWTIPVAVIGAISNINYLTNKVPFLSFINSIPPVILGLVTGLLPVILLAVLMALVPIVCNILAKLFEPTQSAVQMKVQGWYFPFQVIQVFLITTFSSGAASVATQIIQQPTTAPTLLAQNLPKASNFYIAYFILFGLNTAAMQVLNVVPLLFVLFLGKILDKTPRKMYNRYVNLAGLGWGALYPKFTNLGVIALSYSCISPLILGFATVGFYLLYLAYRYNALFTLGTNVSTRGNSYARALKQLVTGIYLSEICLIGLFAIGIGKTNQSIGPLVLMLVFLVVTIAWQVWLGRSLKKLEESFFEDTTIHESQEDIEKNGSSGPGPDHTKPSPVATPQPQKTGFVARLKEFFYPDTSASTIAALVSSNLGTSADGPRAYTQGEHDEAYIHPAIISECPTIWIAKDKYGLSKQEMEATRKEVGDGVLKMTDDGAWFDEKGNVAWSEEISSAPIWEDEKAF